MKKLISISTLTFFALLVKAQDVKMADVMKDNGKIYVVIAVMLTILAGLVLYLVRLDRKRLRKLIKSINTELNTSFANTKSLGLTIE